MKEKIVIVSIVGARPQFIKAAVMSRNLRNYDNVEEIIVHTGQHYDANMSNIFFTEMDIPKPDLNLNINQLSHAKMTGNMICELEDVLIESKPDCILVFGDTNSTLAAAICAKKLGIKIAHIEAGVRNFDDSMPEEINRYIVDRISDFNFCCTEVGVENLKIEGFESSNINSEVYNYGDVMYDAALYYEEKSKSESTILKDLGIRGADYVITTVHREENTSVKDRLTNIIIGLNEINKEIRVVLPIHPRTRNVLKHLTVAPEFTVIDPVGYLDMIQLISNAQYCITDSGGVVRESYFFKKPSIYLLQNHVWPELSEAGVSLALKPEKGLLEKAFKKLKAIQIENDNIFGDGKAGQKISERLVAALS